jgi:hypothetical protein
MDRYPSIKFVLDNRRLLQPIISLTPALLGLWGAWRTGAMDWLIIGLLLAPLVHIVSRVAFEIVDLIADTLIPK